MTREDAINILRETHDNSLFSVRTALETLIPELKESEDERIRQGLVKLLTVAGERYVVESTGIKKESYLAYLERQKEFVSEDFESIWKTEDCKDLLDEGEKLSPRFKEMFKEVCHSWYDKGIEVGEKQKEQKPNFDTHWENGSMVCEQKEEKVEWSEEDIEKNLIAYLRYERKSTPQEIEEKFIPYIKRIKIMEQESVSPMSYGSLDEAMQEAGRRFDLPYTDEDKYSVADVFYAGVRAERESKQEWSKEDENALREVELNFSLNHDDMTPDLVDCYERFFKKVKSLRPQPHTVSIKDATKFGNLEYERGVKDGIQYSENHRWKPSEEQLSKLSRIAEGIPDDDDAELLIEIYEHLTKL